MTEQPGALAVHGRMRVLHFIGCIVECIEWHEVKKGEHYYLTVEAMTKPMQVREHKDD